jgi:4-diphosphocytidyl-2-C-methyl-D-erythritol kinase
MLRNSDSLTLRPPAKINWFLKILDKRADGYHNIVSFMQFISLYDRLTLEHSASIDVISNTDIPREDNLIYKAASRLKQYASYPKGAKILLDKNIPIGAGLGGGSSDAAYTLSGLNKLWKLKLNREELSLLALEIGSDIPFFFKGPCAHIEGRGEKVTPYKITRSYHLLIVNPLIPISSAWAYTSYDSLNRIELTKKQIDIKLFCYTFNTKGITFLEKILENDLEKAVIKKYPVVKEIKNRLLANGAVISAMSGSGSTVFGVFKSKEEAQRAEKTMKPHWCKIVKTLI